MARNANGQLRFLIEEAGEFGLTISGLSQVKFEKPKGEVRVTQIQCWLEQDDRAGYYDGVWKLAAFISTDGIVDSYDYLFTDPDTAMEFKLKFG
jgi:hypothetical protein